MMGDPKIHHAVRSDGARSGRKTKEQEEKTRRRECRWSSRGVAQRPRELEKNDVNLTTSSVGAWQHKSARALLFGVRQTAQRNENKKKRREKDENGGQNGQFVVKPHVALPRKRCVRGCSQYLLSFVCQRAAKPL